MDQKKSKRTRKPKASGIGAVSNRPTRVSKRNRLFLDSEIWDNANSSTSSLPPVVTSTPKSSKTPGLKRIDERDVSMEQIHSSNNAPASVVPPLPDIPVNAKKKKFIRFRFQIDCSAATDVDDLIHFLKNNMKIEGKKGNLSEVTIERRNLNVNILSKVMLAKKYLKLLSKQYLKDSKQFYYRVLTKNKRAYKILPK